MIHKHNRGDRDEKSDAPVRKTLGRGRSVTRIVARDQRLRFEIDPIVSNHNSFIGYLCRPFGDLQHAIGVATDDLQLAEAEENSIRYFAPASLEVSETLTSSVDPSTTERRSENVQLRVASAHHWPVAVQVRINVLNCTAGFGRQSLIELVSADSLRKTGIFADYGRRLSAISPSRFARSGVWRQRRMREKPGFPAYSRVIGSPGTQDCLAALGGIELRHSRLSFGL